MKPNTAKLTSPRTDFGSLSMNARAIWRGPRSIVVNHLDGERFYGWPNLVLETRDWKAVRVESRSVYANPFDKTQNWAILRAVYWDASKVRRELKTHPKMYELIMPARFVVVPVRRLKAWLAEFSDLSIRIPISYDVDKSASVKRVRIEQDYLSQVFEKVWQTQSTEHALLNERWNRVWKRMTKALVGQSIVKGIHEDFWFVSPEVRYDLRTYQPERYAP